MSAKHGYLLIHRTSISSRRSSQSASCNACDLPSFQTFVNAHTRFFLLCHGYVLYYGVTTDVAQSECFMRTYERLGSAGKLRKTSGSGIWVRTEDPLRSIVRTKERPGLGVIYSRYTSSLHFSQCPEALVQSHVLPWSAPSRRVPFLGRERRRASRRAVSLSLSCQDRKEVLPIAIRKTSLRPYARSRLGLRKYRTGEPFLKPF